MPSLCFNFPSHSIFSLPSVNFSLRLKPSINVRVRKFTCDLQSTEAQFETNSSQITLLKPCKEDGNNGGPLFVYAPGMDCTVRGIRKQLRSLCSAGYDVRCIYIPSTDRSSWNEIVDSLIPLLEEECRYKAQNRHITLMGESFGAVLALRIACAAPELISRMIMINSATNLKFSNPFASVFAQTGLLATLPNNIYALSQRIALALMVKYDLISKRGIGDISPTIDSFPADCVAWRFSMLNDDAGLSEDDIRSIGIPTLVPRRPVLFVGNHTLFGGYDTPILLYELFLRGFHARGLAHPAHWYTMIGSIFERYGHVKTSNFAAYQLLKDGESILLFPGGAREVYKKKGESYKLIWKSSTQFVRMASRFKAIIIPFAALGGDDAFTVLTDSDELLDSPIGPFLKEICSQLNLGPEIIPPITALPGTTIPSLFPIPSIERIYFHFAEPIDTASYSEILNDRKQTWDINGIGCMNFTSLYSLVKKRIEESIDKLQHIHLNDPERGLQQRLISNISSSVSNIYKM